MRFLPGTACLPGKRIGVSPINQLHIVGKIARPGLDERDQDRVVPFHFPRIRPDTFPRHTRAHQFGALGQAHRKKLQRPVL